MCRPRATIQLLSRSLLLSCAAALGCANVLDYDEVAFDGGVVPASTTGGSGGQPVPADAPADSPEAAPVDDADPCESVACGAQGTCVVGGSGVACACEPGYHDEGLQCVADPPPGPCDSVTCGAFATCSDGTCYCDDGYEGDPTAGCEAVNPLEATVRAELVAIATAELGFCEGVDDKPYMQSQPGFWCYDFVAWVYGQSSHPLPSPQSLPAYQTGSLPAWWRPEPGDLIKYDIQHFGMVASVSPDGLIVSTIEGNVNSCVMARSTTDASVEYYGTLDGAF